MIRLFGVTQKWKQYQAALQLDDETAAMERELARKMFAARVAGVCVAVVFVGGLVALLWGTR